MGKMKNRVIICNSDKKCIVSDVDVKNRKVKFYPVVWNSIDTHKRMYLPKSANRTINANKSRFPHLIEHNAQEVVGITIESGVDGKGLWVVSRLANTTKGLDTLQLYDEGIYKYHSFMGWVINSTTEVMDNMNIEVVSEFAMEEVTTTLFPANKNATLIQLQNALREGTLNNNQLEQLINPAKDDNSVKVDKTKDTPQPEVQIINDQLIDDELIDFIENYQ